MTTKTISSTVVKKEPKRPIPPKTADNHKPKFIGAFELLHDDGGYFLLKPSLVSVGSYVRHEVPYATGYALSQQRDSAPPMTITNH